MGDWTGDLWNLLNPEKKLGVVQENLLTAPDGSPIFRIDGPYGTASEEVFDYKVRRKFRENSFRIFFFFSSDFGFSCGGNRCDPIWFHFERYSVIRKFLEFFFFFFFAHFFFYSKNRYRIETQGQASVEKVYFFWISRDKNAFEWFNEVLAALEQENILNFLEIQM